MSILLEKRHNYYCIFLFRKGIILKFLSFRQFRLWDSDPTVRSSPALENSLSEGTDDAGEQRFFCLLLEFWEVYHDFSTILEDYL